MSTSARFRELRLLTDNAAAWQAKRALIRGAERSLELAYFILEDDASSRALLDDLRNAAERGVQVRLLLDHLMAWRHTALLQRCAAGSSLQIRLFRPPAASWRQAMDKAGIDTERFLVGLSGPDTGLLLQSLTAHPRVPASWADALRRIAQAPAELRLAHVLQVLAQLQQLAQGALAGSTPGVGDMAEALARLQAIVAGLRTYLHRTHHKLLLADQRRFIMGGRNLADAYHRSDAAGQTPFQDTDLQACDSRACSAEHLAAFETLWAQGVDVRDTAAPKLVAQPAQHAPQACVPGAFDQATRSLPDLDGFVVNGLPGSTGQSAITDAYSDAIRRFTARGQPGRIDIVSAYLFLDDGQERSSPTLQALRQSLLDAAAVDGITVNLYTNSLASTDLRPVNAAFYQCMGALIAGGIRIHELRPGHGSLHTKAAAIGDDCLLIGSYNMDPRSELYDTNNLIVLHDPQGQATQALRAAWTEPACWTRVTAQAAAALQAQTAEAAQHFALLRRLL